MQRLKRIGQYGVPDEYNATFIRNFSRFEHSIGTMLLLKKLGAAEEEQIAGLLHDASHTAFSHVVDYVVGSYEKEDFQDKMHKNVIHGPEITRILQTYGYEPDRIAAYANFTLLEQPVPNICADRIDYGIREFPLTIAQQCLDAMTVYRGNIVFSDRDTALLFARHYLVDVQEGIISNNESAIRYMLFSHILKLAMEKNIITFDDFWTDDESVMRKIHAAKDKAIDELLQIMRKTPLVRDLPQSHKTLPKKFRYIDPEILYEEDKLIRLSKIDEEFAKEIDRAKDENDQKVPVPQILSPH
jgi:HD superfamily phosphohydrolase